MDEMEGKKASVTSDGKQKSLWVISGLIFFLRLIQPLGSESPCLGKHSEKRQWIRLLGTSGRMDRRSLFQFSWCVEKIFPTTQMDLLRTHTLSSCCLCSMLEPIPCVTYIHHHVSYPMQHGGVGTCPRTMVSLWHGAPGGKSIPASAYNISFSYTSERWELPLPGPPFHTFQISSSHPACIPLCSWICLH